MSAGVTETCPSPFETSPTVDKLLPALIAAQAAFKPATKGAENEHFRRRYADLSDVWDSCSGPLQENKFAVLYPMQPNGEGIDVSVVLWHESGQWIRSWLTLRADLKRPQEIGSGITYFRRYLLASLLAISTADDDGEAAMPRQESRKGERRPRERDDRRREVNESFQPRDQPRQAERAKVKPANGDGDHGAMPAKRDETWAAYVAKVVRATNDDWRAELAMEGVDDAKREDLVNQFQLLNRVCSRAVEAQLLLESEVSKDDKPGARDQQKALKAVSDLFARMPGKVRKTVEAYITDKKREMRAALGMFDPDMPESEAAAEAATAGTNGK